MNKYNYVVLAAGNSSRFGPRNKLLYDLCGKPILSYSLDRTQPETTILIANEEVAASHSIIKKANKVVIQDQPKGTGDSFQKALNYIDPDLHTIVLLGDSVLNTKRSIEKALRQVGDYDLVFGAFQFDKPNQYGRVIQVAENKYKVLEYKEHKAATQYYNAGWICFNKKFIGDLPRIEDIYSELYLTQYIEKASKALIIEVPYQEALGINSIADYSLVRSLLQQKILEEMFMSGVDVVDPTTVQVAHDTKIAPGARIEQYVVFGKNVKIGANSIIMPFCKLEDVEIGSDCIVGPFAHIKGNSQILDQSHIGSFCELNRSILGNKSKAKHLTYIGDAEIGSNVNIGAGTVFCNFDGNKKNKTVIKNDAFLGGNSSYVAPVVVEEGGYVGAGTILRRNVPSQTLVAAKQQVVIARKGKNK